MAIATSQKPQTTTALDRVVFEAETAGVVLETGM
jgi:hypothetical protein